MGEIERILRWIDAYDFVRCRLGYSHREAFRHASRLIAERPDDPNADQRVTAPEPPEPQPAA